MRIQEHISSQSNPIDAVTTSNGAFFVSEQGVQKANTIDISSIVMDDEAYKGQGMTVKDVMQEAGGKNVSTLRDYMTIMSNFMSDEDYAELVKDGKSPGSMEATEMVTSLDKIKAALAQAGVQIEGFTDTLDRTKLEEMFGDSMNASIGEMLSKKDVPPTNENVEAVQEAFEEGTALTEITDETKKYIVKNDIDLTINNLYKSQFSAGTNKGKISKGYYKEDLSGYLSKKSETLNWEGLEAKAKEIIQSAGFEGTKEELQDAKWMIEEGLPLKEETFSKLQELKSLELPINKEVLLEEITTAVANGKTAKNTLLTGENNLINEAIRIKEEVDAADIQAINLIPRNSKITIEAFIQISKTEIKVDEKAQNITAMRQMEEIRFSMSVEANYRLLKSGFSIDTEPLEDVIAQLKDLETNDLQIANFSQEKVSLYVETVEKRESFFALPLAMMGRVAKSDGLGTFNQVYEEGLNLQKQYQDAQEKYEPLATEVRVDLGDSIRKAFANAETLLTELGFENTTENQKAVRILGYNQMELSDENMYKVKEANLTVTRCIEKMTPSKILQMIKNNVNPLETDMEQLEETMDSYEEDNNSKMEQYARFLQHMENKNEISVEERDAYIGIHRLLRQVEKTDGAALGSLINQGAEISLKNLLTAVRTRNRESMDYEVNETFEGVDAKRTSSSNITDQIESYYNKLVVKMADEMEMKNPAELNISMDLTLEEVADKITKFPNLLDEVEEVVTKEAKEFRKIVQTTDDMIYKNLLAYEQPVTVDNMNALSTLMNQRGSMYRKLSTVGKDLEDDELSTEIDNAIQQISDSFVNQEETTNAFENLTEIMKEITSKVMDFPEIGKIDQKAMTLLYKQVSLTTKLAKEENYEVPVMLGNELTSINLKILHQSEEKGKIFISTAVNEIGNMMAELSVTKEEIKGFIATENEESMEIARKMAAHMEISLSEDGNMKVELDVIMIANIQIKNMGNQGLDYKKENMENNIESDTDIDTENNTDEKKQIEQIATSRLYGVAKSFLKIIQEEWE